MPVIFSTPTSHQVTMFDKDAELMLKAMQTSGKIPGALFAEAIPDALEGLQNRIQLDSNDQAPAQSNDKDHVGINTKALPLIKLMQRATDQNEKLMWDKG